MNSQHTLMWRLVAATAWITGCQANGAASRPSADAPAPPPKVAPVAPQAEAESSAETVPSDPKVKIDTSMGEILIEADAENAPLTVMQFLQYVEDNYYDGTIFHRVMKDSVIQGGGYTPDVVEKTRGLHEQIKGSAWQSDLKNKRGTIAMLRGKGPGGGGTGQFYINVADNDHLDVPRNRGLFAVFGKVVGGEDTVERIRQVPVSTHPNYGGGRSAVVPVEPVIIKSVSLVGGFSPKQLRQAIERRAEERRTRDRRAIEKLEAETGSKAVTKASGIRYIDIDTGFGPPVLISDTILFNYQGRLVDGTIFESTMETEPKLLPVADLIEGLRDGILNMNEGGHRYVIVPPERAYGETGIPGLIPPNSMLIYEIEVLEIRAQP